MKSHMNTRLVVKVPEKNYFLILPTYGSPFIDGEVPTDAAKKIERMNWRVRGIAARMAFKFPHPCFGDGNPKWLVARGLLRNKDSKAYSNLNGIKSGMVHNVAFVFGPDGSPIVFGDVIIILSQSEMDALKIVESEWAEENDDSEEED